MQDQFIRCGSYALWLGTILFTINYYRIWRGSLKLVVIIPVKRKLAQVALVMDNRRLHDLSKLSSLDYPISTQFDTKSNYRGGLAWWAVVITIPSKRGSQVTETVGTPHWNREREN